MCSDFQTKSENIINEGVEYRVVDDQITERNFVQSLGFVCGDSVELESEEQQVGHFVRQSLSVGVEWNQFQMDPEKRSKYT
jgi:hypothetical protein